MSRNASNGGFAGSALVSLVAVIPASSTITANSGCAVLMAEQTFGKAQGVRWRALSGLRIGQNSPPVQVATGFVVLQVLPDTAATPAAINPASLAAISAVDGVLARLGRGDRALVPDRARRAIPGGRRRRSFR